jgi:ATP-dependent RNA helicase DeaD
MSVMLSLWLTLSGTLTPFPRRRATVVGPNRLDFGARIDADGYFVEGEHLQSIPSLKQSSPMSFSTGRPALDRALQGRGYSAPTPVQAAMLERLGDRRDLLVSAQTGSGKTIAFGLVLADALMREGDVLGDAGAVRALVLAPTRELAAQIRSELSWFLAHTDARLASAIGGSNAGAEKSRLQRGAHIVVGTPGRMLDHISRGDLDPSSATIVVLDEADEMLDMGFRDELEAILAACSGDRRTILFSATLGPEVTSLARRYQTDPVRIDLSRPGSAHADIEYRIMRVSDGELHHAAGNILRYFDAPTALVFCKTRAGAHELHEHLTRRGFSSVELSGELSQRERNDAVAALKSGRARVCVATDVAARGLDIADLELVIHVDLPANRDILLHRSGRTGRAGRKGASILIATPSQKRRIAQLVRGAGLTMEESDAPSAEVIEQRDASRLLEAPLMLTQPSANALQLARALRSAFSADAIAEALAARLIDERPKLARLTPPAMDDRPAPRGQGQWFEVDIGRRDGTDPRQILQLLGSLAGLSGKAIGSIKIADERTRFELFGTAAAEFAQTRCGDDAPGRRFRPIESPQDNGHPRGKRPDKPRRAGRTGPYEKRDKRRAKAK